jgi:hypothetical protein
VGAELLDVEERSLDPLLGVGRISFFLDELFAEVFELLGGFGEVLALYRNVYVG